MIGSHVLHGLAWASLRVLPPRRAFELTRLVGRVLPQIEPRDAPTIAARLRGGTCLTRSVAVASRVRGASVTIGGTKSDGIFSGHAWVELEGRPLSGQTPTNAILARLT